jgi:hypothetical protein
MRLLQPIPDGFSLEEEAMFTKKRQKKPIAGGMCL